MSVLREISDKKSLVEALREMSGRDTGNVVVSTMPSSGEKFLFPGTQSWFRIVMCLSGEYRFEYYNSGLKEAVLPLDSLLVTLPGGYLAGKGDSPYRGAQIIIREGFIRYLLVDNFESQWYHTANPLPTWGQRALQGFCSLPLDGEFDRARIKLTEALVRLALIELERDSSAKKGKAFGTYHAALEFMREHLHQELDRDKVARAAGVTASHLSKLFQRFESREFNQALKAIRIERATPLLRDSALTVDEIASLCGFKTATHFIRVFKAHAGMTPGRFRGDSVPA